MNERDEAIALANRVLDRPHADPDDDLAILARQFLREIERGAHAKEEERRRVKNLQHNMTQLMAAIVWHLNNMDENGNPTTTMEIPNAVYEVVDKKIAQLPSDSIISSNAALQIARKKSALTPKV